MGMTKRDAVIATVQISGFSDAAVDKAVMDNFFEPDGTYNPETDKKAVAQAAIDVLQGMRSIASISEGGFSVSYSLAGIDARLNYLSGLYDITLGPVVKAEHLW